MRKRFKRLPNKIFAMLMIFGIIFQIFAPIMVMAMAVADANEVSIGGSPTIDGNTFNYTNGSVTVTKNNEPVNTTSFTVAQDDVIRITLAPNNNYDAMLQYADGGNAPLDNNVYEFKIGHATGGTLSFTPSFVLPQDNPNEENLRFDLTINGEDFTDVSIGEELTVSDNFNMNTLSEFYVTRITDGDIDFRYEDEEYSLDMIDSQDERIIDAHLDKQTDNYAIFHAQSDPTKILGATLTFFGRESREHYFALLLNVKLKKAAFRGVEITTSVMPDIYDSTVWNGADLSESTLANPGIVTAYYGEDTINFSSDVSNPVEEISLVDGKGVPNSAVEIDNDNGTIRILSNYYNKVLVKVKLVDGTEGYININRIGIFIGELEKDATTFYHGEANRDAQNNFNVETNKERLVAVFYHENITDYDDYDLIVNITYTDGKKETRIATGVGDVDNIDDSMIGSDYILWSGDSLDVIEKASVTALKKGAISNEITFGGVTFGSGSGVVWEKE